ncbi:MAG: hypothetical protein LUO89_01190, partial [Methanothrix sp.]|nr:hypothetical protein [Methanothrix sp.]
YQMPTSDPAEPNLRSTLEGEEDMVGFVRGSKVVFYRNNDNHCGGPSVNLGRELIIGTVTGGGRTIIGSGMGFDSNPGCGATWNYHVVGRKISDNVP